MTSLQVGLRRMVWEQSVRMVVVDGSGETLDRITHMLELRRVRAFLVDQRRVVLNDAIADEVVQLLPVSTYYFFVGHHMACEWPDSPPKDTSRSQDGPSTCGTMAVCRSSS